MSGVFQDAYERVVEAPTGITATTSVAFDVKGMNSQALQLSGTWVGTVQFEGTIDDTNWFALAMTPLAGGAAVTSSTANGLWTRASSVGLSQVRARCSAFTSGTIQVTSSKHPR